MSEGLTESLREKLASYRRTSWKPIVKDGDGPVDASKFSGTPWLSKDMEWPVCPKCNKPMRFFVQLNLANLPKDLKEDFGTGLLQMFLCTNEKSDCPHDAVSPFAKSVLVRIIQSGGEGKDVELPGAQDLFPPKLITGWESCDDYPCSEEGVDMSLNDEEWNMLYEISLTGDKLWGWPVWVQSGIYPRCPACDRRMILVFQIGSYDNLPYIFGDYDRGWITQCPEHKEKLTFFFDTT